MSALSSRRRPGSGKVDDEPHSVDDDKFGTGSEGHREIKENVGFVRLFASSHLAFFADEFVMRGFSSIVLKLTSVMNNARERRFHPSILCDSSLTGHS